MDFVISKVVMSICALLVAGVLASALCTSELRDSGGELNDIVSEFSGIADRAFKGGSQGLIKWVVPSMSDGSRIVLTVADGSVLGEAEDHRAAMRSLCYLHTWRWNGSSLNDSMISKMDSSSGPMKFGSGDKIALVTILVQLDDDTQLLVFTHPIIE